MPSNSINDRATEIPQHWSPPEWSLCCFPLPYAGAEAVSLDWLVAALHAVLDTVTEADTSPLSRALHVAHMLVTRQGADGCWSTAYSTRTGEEIGEERSFAPIPLFRRMNAMLGTTEFDSACFWAEAGGYIPADGKE